MRCPSCEAEISDSSAVFCSRCGAPLASEEAANTSRLDLIDADRGETARLEPAGTPGPATSIRRTLYSGGWTDAAAAAAVAVLGLLCIAAFLLLAPKLQDPGFARGASPVAIFNGVVIVALGILRVPIHIGGITVSALPLGALAVAALTIVWSVQTAFSKRDERISARTQGAKVGVIFGMIVWVFALAFRFRGKEQVSADALWSLLLGVMWGTVFAASAIANGQRSWRRFATEILKRIEARSRRTYEAVVGAGIMMAGALVLSAGVLLLWMIIGLARGAPYDSFGVGDATAAVIYLAAFLPNVLVLIIALAFGAPIWRGVQVGFEGRLIGGLQEVSLFDWPGGAPSYAYLVLAVPLVACLLGGFYMGNTTKQRDDALKTIVLAAVIFAAALAIVGWLGEARLGAGLVKQRGLARVAMQPLPAFILAALWAAVAGGLGWIASERVPKLRRGPRP